MRVIIAHFRCYDEPRTFDFPDGHLIMVKGESGAGKSTILQAVSWCLYGRPNRGLDPHGKKNAKSTVTVIIPGLTVARQRNPGLLRVENSGITTTNPTEAQAVINRVLGEYEIWSPSCYISQGMRSSFFDLRNDEKMTVLNKIAFSTENPEAYIEAIAERIRTTETVLATAQRGEASARDQFEPWTSIDISNVTEIKDLQELAQQVAQREREEAILSALQSQIEPLPDPIPIPPLVDRLNSLAYQISLAEKRAELEKQLHGVPNYDGDFTDQDLMEARSQEHHYQTNKNKASQLNINYDSAVIAAEISAIENVLEWQHDCAIWESLKRLPDCGTDDLYTHEDLSRAVEIETARAMEMKKLDGLAYNKEEIDRSIEELTAVLDWQNDLVVRERTKGAPEGDFTTDDVLQASHQEQEHTHYRRKAAEMGVTYSHEAIQKQIAEWTAIIENCLACPHCGKGVRFQNGTLVISSGRLGEKVISEAETKRIEQNIQNLRYVPQPLHSAESINQALERNGTRVPPPGVPLLTASQLSQARNRLCLLRTIKVIDSPPVSSSVIRASLDQAERKTLLGQLQHSGSPPCSLLPAKEQTRLKNRVSQLRSIEVVDQPSPSSFVIECTMKWKKLKEFPSYDVSQLDQDHRETHHSLEKARDLEAKRTVMNKLQREYQTKLQNLTPDVRPELNTQTAYQLHLQLQTATQDREAAQKRLLVLRQLYQRAIETECQTLHDTVNSINRNIEDIAITIFNRPINVILSLEKELKTDKRVKHQVNFAISYQGGELDSIDQLSGGEGDRASLALAIALNRNTSCPFFMIDEVLASLDIDMKEIVVEAMREHLHGRTVIVISHDGTEGHYDDVVSL